MIQFYLSSSTESPQPMLSTAQILSMFPTQPVGGSPYTTPPYSPTTVPWGQQGLMGNQWAGPWPSVPGVPAWVRPGVTPPPVGGQLQAFSVTSPQPGCMGGGPAALLVPNNSLETLPTPTGSAGNLGPPNFNSNFLLWGIVEKFLMSYQILFFSSKRNFWLSS